MIIRSVDIKKFRGFQDLHLDLGKNITVISGRNGTQKTTLLGIISQPFSLTNHPTMSKELPLCGGNYKSAFSDKFKLSSTFDLPKSHEWTLHLCGSDEPFTIESIQRDKKHPTSIRFWRKGNRSKVSGYIQLPVIYLSLKRLLPIGEDYKLHPSSDVVLEDKEKEKLQRLHNEILCIHENIQSTEYLKSVSKDTLGVNTDQYDWQENSAGQDDLGKILLAMMSFVRLKKKYPKDYKGGMLIIDEIDATLYPAAQVELFDKLLSFSDKYKVQIVLTTHSIPFIKRTLNKQIDFDKEEKTNGKIRLVYLEKQNGKIINKENISYDSICNRLNVVSPVNEKIDNKIDIYCEDLEAIAIANNLLYRYRKDIHFVKIKLGCSELINLVEAKIPPFTFPNCIVLLDGDVNKDSNKLKKIKKMKNVITLPSKESPEQMFTNYLFNDIGESNPLWEKINNDYNKDVCFRGYEIEKILSDRTIAKQWFQGQKNQYKKWCSLILKSWKKNKEDEYFNFLDKFEKNFKFMQGKEKY